MLPRSCWVLLLFCAAARFFGWLGLSTALENLGTPLELGVPPEVGTPLPRHVPFNMTTGDEWFQAEATCWVLSPLPPSDVAVGLPPPQLANGVYWDPPPWAGVGCPISYVGWFWGGEGQVLGWARTFLLIFLTQNPPLCTRTHGC